MIGKYFYTVLSRFPKRYNQKNPFLRSVHQPAINRTLDLAEFIKVSSLFILKLDKVRHLNSLPNTILARIKWLLKMNERTNDRMNEQYFF